MSINQTITSGVWTWEIENFSKYQKMSEKLSSPYFDFMGGQNVWRINCYPNGGYAEDDDDKAVSLFLDYNSSYKFHKTELQFKFSIITSDFKTRNEQMGYHVGDKKSYGFSKFIKRSTLLAKANAYLPNDCLTISCQMTRTMNAAAVDRQPAIISVPENDQQKKFQSCILEQNFGDVIILRVGNKEFQVYKSVLTLQSPVFKAMFDNTETKENQEKVVTIDGIKAEVVEELLKFLHTGEIPEFSDYLSDLINAAEKYQLNRLKALCERALYDELNVENSIWTLTIADLYKASQLKIAAIGFIKTHIDAVMELDDYKLLKNANPLLVCEILEGVCKKRRLE